jgi:4-hydroxy-3-methylbut-2-enyl diphosphate reductase
VKGSVLIPENSEGYVILSLREATQGATWDRLKDAKEKETAINVIVRGAGPSGITVEVEGLIGFIPFSQLGKEASESPQSLIGKNIKAIVIEIEKSSNKVVLSERAVSEAGEMKLAKEALARVKEGEVYDGIVTTVANFGCFVRIDIKEEKGTIPVEGLVHISEISWSKVVSVSDVVKEGDSVKVKVIGIKGGKLSFSMKGAEKDPWENAAKKYPPESKVKGKVIKLTDFGVFVEVESGIEGLIHITSIPPGYRLAVGDEVNCYVQGVDDKAKKLSLGLVLTTKPVGYK